MFSEIHEKRNFPVISEVFLPSLVSSNYIWRFRFAAHSLSVQTAIVDLCLAMNSLSTYAKKMAGMDNTPASAAASKPNIVPVQTAHVTPPKVKLFKIFINPEINVILSDFVGESPDSLNHKKTENHEKYWEFVRKELYQVTNNSSPAARKENNPRVTYRCDSALHHSKTIGRLGAYRTATHGLPANQCFFCGFTGIKYVHLLKHTTWNISIRSVTVTRCPYVAKPSLSVWHSWKISMNTNELVATKCDETFTWIFLEGPRRLCTRKFKVPCSARGEKTFTGHIMRRHVRNMSWRNKFYCEVRSYSVGTSNAFKDTMKKHTGAKQFSVWWNAAFRCKYFDLKDQNSKHTGWGTLARGVRAGLHQKETRREHELEGPQCQIEKNRGQVVSTEYFEKKLTFSWSTWIINKEIKNVICQCVVTFGRFDFEFL